MGSKNRIAKYIVPIIQSYITEDTKGYLEPFVGGANVIDKIKCNNRIGCDTHKHLISLLNHVKNKDISEYETCTKEHYSDVRNSFNNQDGRYEDWYVGLIGFCASFAARFFDGGYARSYNKDGTCKNLFLTAKNNIVKQSKHLKDVEFIHSNFLELPKDKIKGYVIYCDPPYKDSKQYSTSKNFPYEEFYLWAKDMSIHNTVLISEYWMPDDFECIWEKETTTQIDSGRNANSDKNVRIERLYTYKSK